jgi:hypothetical protein
MSSDLKRIIVTAALAAAAFNATALASHPADPFGAPTATAHRVDVPIRAEDGRPRRVRFDRCTGETIPDFHGWAPVVAI